MPAASGSQPWLGQSEAATHSRPVCALRIVVYRWWWQ